MNKHRCYRAGPLSGCRNEWTLLLFKPRRRAFGMFWKMYAGVDLEFNLTAAQMRMLAQIGASM